MSDQPWSSDQPSKIFLIDDNSADNLYHRLVLEEILPDTRILTFDSGAAALAFFADPGNAQASDSGLVLVDLNMPAMNGWEFIDAFGETEASQRTDLAVLSTTENPTELRRAEEHPSVSGFVAKPLTEPKLKILASRRAIKRAKERRQPEARSPSPSRTDLGEPA